MSTGLTPMLGTIGVVVALLAATWTIGEFGTRLDGGVEPPLETLTPTITETRFGDVTPVSLGDCCHRDLPKRCT